MFTVKTLNDGSRVNWAYDGSWVSCSMGHMGQVIANYRLSVGLQTLDICEYKLNVSGARVCVHNKNAPSMHSELHVSSLLELTQTMKTRTLSRLDELNFVYRMLYKDITERSIYTISFICYFCCKAASCQLRS